MKFAIHTITLWSHKGEMRQLHFKLNKVNVLTGGSHRGKSAIVDIFDYCFLSSKHKISTSIINENTAWYGITFGVNEKQYTIARKSPSGNTVSDDIYFSSVGEIPASPRKNIDSIEVKKILEAEFRIDEAVKVAYGGGALRANSSISFRYFFLFNTISEDIITSRDTYFDKQSEDRYREALPRIFDLAMGIDTIQNIATREEKEKLERQLEKAQRRSSRIDNGRSDFDEELRQIAARASEFGLPSLASDALTPSSLKQVLTEARIDTGADELKEHAEVTAAIFAIDRRLRQLNQFSKEITRHKRSSEETHDSLKPIVEILNQSKLIVKSEVFDDLISTIKADLEQIKKATERKQPVDSQIKHIKTKLLSERKELNTKLLSLPSKPDAFQNEKEKWLFVGENIGRLNVLFPSTGREAQALGMDTSDLERRISELQVQDVQAKRDAVLSLINEIAAQLMRKTKDALDNYSTWHPEFVYAEKRLRVRKPLSSLIENVGSSSNHMFMHLLHFLSLHEAALVEKSPFIPAFLIIDQPSRPYYPEKAKDEKKLVSEEDALVRIAFELLNEFISDIKKKYDSDFQMIVFEHVETEAFEGLENVHVLPEFRGAERLIPESWYQS